MRHGGRSSRGSTGRPGRELRTEKDRSGAQCLDGHITTAHEVVRGTTVQLERRVESDKHRSPSTSNSLPQRVPPAICCRQPTPGDDWRHCVHLECQHFVGSACPLVVYQLPNGHENMKSMNGQMRRRYKVFDLVVSLGDFLI